MDLAQSLAERNAARYAGDNPQTRYLEENSPVPVDGSYIVKNNIQDVPDSEEVTEAELVDLESDRGQVWAAASRVIYDAMYDNVNALTIKKPESEQDFARFGVEFMGQFDHNISQMGYNVAKLQNVDDRTKAAMYHLQSEFGRLPMFSWNGVRRATKGIFTDPTTYAALGSVGLGFFGRAGVKQTTKEGFKGMLRKGIANPYTISAIEGGAYGGLYDYFTQEVELEANMRDSIDRGRLATSTAIGSAAGPALVGAGELAGKAVQRVRRTRRNRQAQDNETGDLFDDPDDAPTQAQDTQMDAMAGARIFDTDNYQPPTSDNPVSVVKPKDDEPGIIAFHGSGADFDEFKLEKIGTGEGMQAYGYGLYFSDSEDIAGFYKNMLTRSVDIDGKKYIRGNTIFKGVVDPAIEDDLAATNGDLEAAIKNSQEFLQEMVRDDNVEAIRSTRNELEKLEQLRGKISVNDEGGKTYKVGLAPKPDELLDFDKPYEEQSQIVQKQLTKAGYASDPKTNTSGQAIIETLMTKIAQNLNTERDKRLAEINMELGILSKIMDEDSDGYRQNMSQQGIDASNEYDRLMEERASLPKMTKDEARRLASEKLANAGIPGIRYSAGQQTPNTPIKIPAPKNYVIFDDQAIKVLEKYGIVGPVSVSALSANMSKDDDTDVANAPKTM